MQTTESTSPQNTLSVEELAQKLVTLKFTKFAIAINDLRKNDPEKAAKVLQNVSEDVIVEKILKCKYPAFLQSFTSMLDVDNKHLTEVLLDLPQNFLFQADRLENIYEFNRLMYILYKLDQHIYAKQLVIFASQDLFNYLKVNDVRTLTSFLQLVANYREIKTILTSHGKNLHHKIRNYVPKTNRDRRINPIPALMGIVSDNDKRLAEELVKQIDDLVRNYPEEIKWESYDPPKAILALAYCQLAKAYSNDEEEPNYQRSEFLLTKAIQLFRNLKEHKHYTGLCGAYFLKAQNAMARNDKFSAAILAKQAKKYAEKGELPERIQELDEFLEKCA